MNAVDLYFLNKANDAVDDEYLTEIQQVDIDNLEKAKRRILILPLLTLAVTYLIKASRDSIFISNNFLVNIMTVRRKYKETKFKSKTYEERKDKVDEIADPYRQIAEERRLEKEARQSIAKEEVKTQPIVQTKQNPDPFELRLRKQGIVPASRTYSGSQKHESFQYKDGPEEQLGVRGNQVVNKGSAYTNLLRTYTEYEDNKRYEKTVLSAAERDERRNRRFKYFKRINFDKIRDKVMKSKFKSSGWLFVVIPTALSVVAGFTNYATVSFGVYLKYQAMVDTYYNRQLAFLAIEDAKNKEIKAVQSQKPESNTA
jgi:hypothetical protein